MPKSKNKMPKADTFFIGGVVIVIFTICGVLTFTLNHNDTVSVPRSARINTGMMRYKIVDNKAVKRTDDSVKALQAFLDNEAARSGCAAAAPAYERVAAYTADESQVLIRYGCGAADSPMYAVKTANGWKSLSPTNHFDTFGIPECSHVDRNRISSEIAPVCVSDLDTATTLKDLVYTARR